MSARKRPLHPGILLDDMLAEVLAEEQSKANRRSLTEEQLGAAASEALAEIAPKFAKMWATAVLRRAPADLRVNRRQRRDFERRLHTTWRAGFDTLETLIFAFLEYGAGFCRDGLVSRKSARDPRYRALTLLHARACRVAFEVLCLVKAGFADGAYARWRTLHEIAVVAKPLSEHDADLSTRYLLHRRVEVYKAAQRYQERCGELGRKPISKRRMAQLQRRSDRLCARFGLAFAHDNGWAAELLQSKRPTFYDIEVKAASVGFRLMYQAASGGVHAGARGLAPLGAEAEHGRDFILVGATNAGLAEPAVNTAFSLMNIAVALLTHREAFKHSALIHNSVMVQAMRIIADRCHEAFVAAEAAVESLRGADAAEGKTTRRTGDS